MKTRNIFIAFSILLACGLLVLSSCTKPAAGAQGPAGPAYTSGSIFGFVTLYDQYGVKEAQSAVKGITVTLDGTSLTAITDSTGKYTFNNMATGIYNISITNPNYAPDKVKNISVLLGPSQHDIHLGLIPNFAFTSVTPIDTVITNAAGTINYVKVRGVAALDTRTREVLIFVSADSSVVSSSPATWLSVYATTITAGKTTFSLSIAETDLFNLGFTSGNAVYIMTYPAGVNYASASEYEDLATGKIIYNEVGPLPVWNKVVIP